MLLKITFIALIFFHCLPLKANDFYPFQTADETRVFLNKTLTTGCLEKAGQKIKKTDETTEEICRCTAQKLSDKLTTEELKKLMVAAQAAEGKKITLEQFFKENPSFQQKLFTSGAECAAPQIEKIMASVCAVLPPERQNECQCFAQATAGGLNTEDLAKLIQIWTLPPQQAIVLMNELLKEPRTAKILLEAQQKCFAQSPADKK